MAFKKRGWRGMSATKPAKPEPAADMTAAQLKKAEADRKKAIKAREDADKVLIEKHGLTEPYYEAWHKQEAAEKEVALAEAKVADIEATVAKMNADIVPFTDDLAAAKKAVTAAKKVVTATKKVTTSTKKALTDKSFEVPKIGLGA